jgi:hypothetical protein
MIRPRATRATAIQALAALLLGACGASDARTTASATTPTTGDEPATVIAVTPAPSPAQPAQLPRESQAAAAPSGAPIAEGPSVAPPPASPAQDLEAASVCPADIPTLEARAFGLREGAALELTAGNEADVEALRTRMRELAVEQARRQRLALAADVAAWDVPREPNTARAPAGDVEPEDEMLLVDVLRLVAIPDGVRLELHRRGDAGGASVAELRRRMREDARALREGRCPILFRPA